MTRARHMLIESQAPAAISDRFAGDAAALSDTGAQVVLLLIQDGVFAAVPEARDSVRLAQERGVELWVDGFSLRQRALMTTSLADSAVVVDMAGIADEILAGDGQVVWH